MEIDFTLPNSRLNTDPKFKLPIGWSCDWLRFDASDWVHNLQRAAIFFVMYKMRSHLAVIRASIDHTQYYSFNLDTDFLLTLTEGYPTLEAFMEKASLWEGGDAGINAVTPFQPMEYDPKSRGLDEIYEEWDEDLLSLE
ncbi:hypothetical protein IW262DRAFT_1468651 [Armillaria fumosa]|nr:hypothetical protein IW262DRAFT_1468651 [Armillaria fumosa]